MSLARRLEKIEKFTRGRPNPFAAINLECLFLPSEADRDWFIELAAKHGLSSRLTYRDWEKLIRLVSWEELDRMIKILKLHQEMTW